MMKSKTFFLSLFLVCFTFGFAQVSQFTPYDELPELNKSYKPVYSDNMPEWGKMLYQYPINFNEVDRAFVKWEAANKDKKTALMRWFKIWRKAITPYVDADGEINMPSIELINRNLMRAQANSRKPFRAPAVGNNSNWTFWGPKETFFLNDGSTETPKPAPWQANVYSFDVTDKDPNLLYAGTETGFVNKTTDKGQTWQITGLNYPFGGGVGAIAIHPENLDTVLVGAGRAIHITKNGGKTWERAQVGSNFGYVNRMRYDYNNPNNAIVAGSNGIYYSIDAGESWRRCSYSDTWDVEYKPGQSDTLFALTKNSSNYFEVRHSFNGGKSFSVMKSFPDSLIQHSGGLLAVTPAAPNSLFAIMLTENANGRPYVYEGILTGDDWVWERRHIGSDGAFTSDKLTNGQGYFDLVLEVSPRNKNMVFAGTTTLFRSTTGGRYFSPTGGYAGKFPVHPDIQDMKILANGDTWVATDGGMNLSTDNFTSLNYHFPLNNMLVGSDFWGFHQGWNEDLIVSGRYHNGNTAISDFYGDKALRMGGGESPTGWVLQGKSRHVVFDDLGSGWILPKTAEGLVEGRFQFSKYPNMDAYGALRSNVATHPYYSGQLYVGSDNALWISKDFGATFDKLYEFEERVRYFDISTANPDVIYVDINGKGLYRSDDGGQTFVRKNLFEGIKGGDIRFVISPYNCDVLYASRTQDAWNSARSEVYKTTNGGTSWEVWSNFGSETLIKTLAIQPTSDGKDLVYAIINTVGFVSGDVKYRKDGDNTNWIDFGTGYPSGMRANHAYPFFRDSKLRIGGNGGVWESPLAETEFTPVVVPWVEKYEYSSPHDTIQFDCHSYVNHKDAVWTWSFSPAASYISDKNARNPKVLFAKPGKYSVALSITQNGVTTSKTVEEMINVRPTPSLDDCENPAKVPNELMKVIDVNNFQPGENGSRVIDGDINTLWHTSWNQTPKHPHHITVDLGEEFTINQVIHTPRIDGDNGRIKDYEIYISNDPNKWGRYVKKDSLENTSAPTTINIKPTVGRYVKLIALSEVQGRGFTSIAELDFVCCRVPTSINRYFSDEKIHAFPIPASNIFTVNLPFQNGTNSYFYSVFNMSGQLMESGKATETQTSIEINVSNYPSGQYFVTLRDVAGVNFRVKFIKK